MITRVCISINNHCILNCIYCHFHFSNKVEFLSAKPMNIYIILDEIKNHIRKNNIPVFKLGFVGNGEPFLDRNDLFSYISYISDYLAQGTIKAYTITNGTIIYENDLNFLKEHNVDVGFSLDGISEIHNKYRCNTFDNVMTSIKLYKTIFGYYPSINCTVSPEIIIHSDEVIDFFSKFKSKITFSRMIGENGISLSSYRTFINKAKVKLDIRVGGYDCTMYGGKCGAGINNIFYANGMIYLCGNCVDLDYTFDYNTPLDSLQFNLPYFDRNCCFKEILESKRNK